ncbi:MAG: hypothetical protein L6265_06880 [Thermoplasmatales archaeon]|nr:hypothetical protein [Thermoplasmatales archaeon]
MPKQIMVTDDVYRLLEDLKKKTKSKSFTETLTKIAEGRTSKDLLASELSAAYKGLKERVSKVDGTLVGIVDRVGRISTNLAKTTVELKAKKVALIEQALDKIAKDITSKESGETEKRSKKKG